MIKDFSLSIVLIVCSFSLAGVFALAESIETTETDVAQVCLEVKREVDQSAQDGLISQAAADSITSRCFNSVFK